MLKNLYQYFKPDSSLQADWSKGDGISLDSPRPYLLKKKVKKNYYQSFVCCQDFVLALFSPKSVSSLLLLCGGCFFHSTSWFTQWSHNYFSSTSPNTTPSCTVSSTI